jgi:hypothetical protein
MTKSSELQRYHINAGGVVESLLLATACANTGENVYVPNLEFCGLQVDSGIPATVGGFKPTSPDGLRARICPLVVRRKPCAEGARRPTTLRDQLRAHPMDLQ